MILCYQWEIKAQSNVITTMKQEEKEKDPLQLVGQGENTVMQFYLPYKPTKPSDNYFYSQPVTLQST